MLQRLAVSPCIPVHRNPTRALSYRPPVCVQTPSHLVTRRSANFKPTIWHDKFIQSISSGDKYEGRNKEKVTKLKEEVRQMVLKEELLRDKLELVDALQQLGVAYHFKEEIKYVLKGIHVSMIQMSFSTVGDLHVISLLFRHLRLHGFSVSEDIFKSYIDNKGDFRIELSSDIQGMLSLYEASYLAKEGEEILEKARQFTTKYLKSYIENSNCTCNNSREKKHVSHALELPLHWRMERLQTRWFIDEYKVEMKMRPALLELAVLDFNLIQTSFKKELKDLSSWWTDLRLYEKLPFIRDRLVENHLWSVAFTFEPKHASLRKVQTKAICLIALFDDIYDVYGSLDELEAFTDAIEQWDLSAMEKLPEYMQICFMVLFNTLNDSAYDILRQKGLNIIPYLRRAWTDLCKSWLAEARWYHGGYSPTLQEYLENAWVSIASIIVFSNAYCMDGDVTAKDLEQFSFGYPEIARLSSMTFRLYDDLGTSKAEIERGDVDKSIQCYIREKKVTESVARQDIRDMILKYWKLMNSQNVGNSVFQEYFRNVALNISRMAQCIYLHGDGYAEPGQETKDRVMSVLLEPIEI
ncbi:Terpene synthase [Rhynchospora pubera]|uniref:Terpene synthase n=1 Tax=Rhynchospora pubera TaxID=906938 RepID=A0AAV8CN48_9POAL|nr:Terpene synthase [Rhynchospora pubera]